MGSGHDIILVLYLYEGAEETDKKPVRMVIILAKIHSMHLPNTFRKHYCLSQLAW